MVHATEESVTLVSKGDLLSNPSHLSHLNGKFQARKRVRLLDRCERLGLVGAFFCERTESVQQTKRS